MEKIINLAPWACDHVDMEIGIFDHPMADSVKYLQTFEAVPTEDVILDRAKRLASLAEETGASKASISPQNSFLIAPLEQELFARGITPVYPRYQMLRVVGEDETDGPFIRKVKKVFVGFVEAVPKPVNMKIVNISGYWVDEGLEHVGLVEPEMPIQKLQELHFKLMFADHQSAERKPRIPTSEEIDAACEELADAVAAEEPYGAAIGGIPFVMAALERALRKRGIVPYHVVEQKVVPADRRNGHLHTKIIGIVPAA